MGNGVPASAAEPSGDSFDPAAGVGKAPAVAADHLHIGQQVMAESNRLGDLQMGKARHYRGGMLKRLFRQCQLEGRQPCVD